MPQTKIQEKFYSLQHEEFINLDRRLTQSELTICPSIAKNDFFGNKLEAACLIFDVNLTTEEV